MLALIVVALVAMVGANPMPAATTTPPILCPAVNKLVTALKQQSPASAFCSSFLRIPIITSIVTVTPTTTIATETATTTIITITPDVPTITVTSPVTCTASSAPAKNKRAATLSKPKAFSAFAVSSAVSTACKCLSVPTSTTTVTTQAIAITITTVTNTQLNTATSTIPVETVTVYALSDGTPFKLQTLGGASDGLYIASTGSEAYTFRASGNDFTLNSLSSLTFRRLSDTTLGVIPDYDPVSGLPGVVRPFLDGSQNILACRQLANFRPGVQRQQCDVECRSDTNARLEWNCGGELFLRDTGTCSRFILWAMTE